MRHKNTVRYQNKVYKNEKKSQEKKSLTSHYRVHHNFSIRGSLHIINLNSKHVQAQMSSRRRIKAREKSIERKLPTKTFDTHLTGSELLQVLKNKEVRWFKNGTSVPEEHRTYLSEPFNSHKAKRIYASREQKAAEKYFVKVDRFLPST